ncbi:MAG: hypothetical protein EB084_22805 [Proteobacteria bacterium]|nr:hypothetical protein [Pseudomonadota bacterium]
MNLRVAAFSSTLIYLLLLTLRAYPVLSPNALAGDLATMKLAMTSPTARIETHVALPCLIALAQLS